VVGEGTFKVGEPREAEGLDDADDSGVGGAADRGDGGGGGGEGVSRVVGDPASDTASGGSEVGRAAEEAGKGGRGGSGRVVHEAALQCDAAVECSEYYLNSARVVLSDRPAVGSIRKRQGTLDWLEMVNIRIQRQSRRNVFTALKLCEPPDTSIMARVRPWVGRTDPSSSGYPLAGWAGMRFGIGATFALLGAVAAASLSLRLWPASDEDIIEHAHDDLPVTHPHLKRDVSKGAGPRHAHARSTDELRGRWPGSS